MPTERAVFDCDECGAEYDSKVEAKRCEAKDKELLEDDDGGEDDEEW